MLLMTLETRARLIARGALAIRRHLLCRTPSRPS
jgi:hypothetical protein